MKDEPFEARMDYLNHLFGPAGEHKQDHVFVLEQTKAQSRDHVLEMLKDIEAKGGEGLMLRKPKSCVPIPPVVTNLINCSDAGYMNRRDLIRCRRSRSGLIMRVLDPCLDLLSDVLRRRS